MVVSDSLIYYVDAGVQRSDDPSSTNTLNNLVNMEPEIFFVNTTESASRKSDDGFYYYVFDGANDYARIDTSDNPNINVRGDVTVGCWCRLDDNEPFAVVSKYSQYILGQNAINEMTFIVYTTSFYPGGYGGAIWGDQSHIDKTKWHYWVGTYRKNSDPDQNGFTSLYCDGEPLVTDLNTYKGSGDNAGVLGDDPNGQVKFFRRDAGSANNHQGAIGLIHCHSRALNAQEIKQNYISTRGRFQR